jgi:hypothetical protein
LKQGGDGGGRRGACTARLDGNVSGTRHKNGMSGARRRKEGKGRRSDDDFGRNAHLFFSFNNHTSIRGVLGSFFFSLGPFQVPFLSVLVVCAVDVAWPRDRALEDDVWQGVISTN